MCESQSGKGDASTSKKEALIGGGEAHLPVWKFGPDGWRWAKGTRRFQALTAASAGLYFVILLCAFVVMGTAGSSGGELSLPANNPLEITKNNKGCFLDNSVDNNQCKVVKQGTDFANGITAWEKKASEGGEQPSVTWRLPSANAEEMPILNLNMVKCGVTPIDNPQCKLD